MFQSYWLILFFRLFSFHQCCLMKDMCFNTFNSKINISMCLKCSIEFGFFSRRLIFLNSNCRRSFIKYSNVVNATSVWYYIHIWYKKSTMGEERFRKICEKSTFLILTSSRPRNHKNLLLMLCCFTLTLCPHVALHIYY